MRREFVAACLAAAVVAVSLAFAGPARAQAPGDGYRTPEPGTEVFPFEEPEPDPPTVAPPTPEDPGVLTETRTNAPRPSSPRALPVTGGDVLALGALGGGLIVAGALLVVRRRTVALDA